MRARLIPNSDGEQIELDKPVLLFGRSPNCDVQLSSRKISRLHCCLCVQENGLYVRDLDSTNGVRVNGDKVSASEIGPGDELIIGDLPFRVVLESGAALPSEDDAVEAESSASALEDSSSPEVVPDDEASGSALNESAMAYEVSSDGTGGSRGVESVVEDDEEQLLPIDDSDAGRAKRQDSVDDDGIDLLVDDDDPFDLGEDSESLRGSSEIPLR